VCDKAVSWHLPYSACRAMGVIVNNVVNSAGSQLGASVLTDLDYAHDVMLLIDDPGRLLQNALLTMEKEAAELGLHVSWSKTKVRNVGHDRTVSR